MKKIMAVFGMSAVLFSSISMNNFVMAQGVETKDVKNPVVSSEMAKNIAETPNINVILDGNVLNFADQKPVIIQGRTLVPFRAVLESMGATVQWDEVNRTVRAQKGATGMVLEIGNTVALVGHERMDLDVPAQIINSRTMVPLRFVSEGLGYKVEFDNSDLNNYKIIITSPEVKNNTENKSDEK